METIKTYDEMTVAELRELVEKLRHEEDVARTALNSAQRALAEKVRSEAHSLVAGLQPDERRALVAALGK